MIAPCGCPLDIKKKDRNSQAWEENYMMKLSQQKSKQNNIGIETMEAIVKGLMKKL